MKLALGLVLSVPLIVSCSHLRESDVVDPQVHGGWTGEGRFLDRGPHEEYGCFGIALTIHADNTVTGNVGSAALVDAAIASRPDDLLIEGRLDGPVCAEGTLPGLNKDWIVLILQPRGESAMGGNVHLRSNNTFDLGMRVCGLELARAP